MKEKSGYTKIKTENTKKNELSSYKDLSIITTVYLNSVIVL